MGEFDGGIIYPKNGDPDTNILLRIRLKEIGFFVLPVFFLIWIGASYESILSPVRSWRQHTFVNILLLVGLLAIVYETYVGLHEVVKIETTSESIILKYWSKPHEFCLNDIQSIEVKPYKWFKITDPNGDRYIFYLTGKRLFFNKARKKQGFDRLINFLEKNVEHAIEGSAVG